jgi:hypothetical protein
MIKSDDGNGMPLMSSHKNTKLIITQEPSFSFNPSKKLFIIQHEDQLGCVPLPLIPQRGWMEHQRLESVGRTKGGARRIGQYP